jgi:hypothetical protein
LTKVHVACVAGDPARPNEDSFVTLPGLLAVLDGVSIPEGLDTGCRHGTAWYAGRLAVHLTSFGDLEPTDLLARAIASTRDDHGGTCDLDHPGTPQAAVAMLRVGPERCDYLVLGDCTLVLDRAGTVDAVTDRRILDAARAQRRLAFAGPIGSAERSERIRALTLAKRAHVNRTGGYWIASTDPAAARHAVRGSVTRTGPDRLSRAALLTDGVSCVVDTYRLTDWKGLLDLADARGPDHVVALARSAEGADPEGGERPRLKPHDDATIVYRSLPPEA